MIDDDPKVFFVEKMSFVRFEIRFSHHPGSPRKRICLTGRTTYQSPFRGFFETLFYEFLYIKMTVFTHEIFSAVLSASAHLFLYFFCNASFEISPARYE